MVKEKLYLVFSILVSHILIVLWGASYGFSYPIRFIDAQENTVIIDQRPQRVVSLVPSITEIILKIGAGDSLKATTYHTTLPPEASRKQVVGGFSSPSLEAIESVRPEVIFLSDHHTKVKEKFGYRHCHLINLKANSVGDIYRNIDLLGKILEREDEATELIGRLKEELDIIARKVAKIPESERKRVIRLMGRDRIMTPGEDSFQNEFIRLAGGIPPELHKNGAIVVISKEEWVAFNPQVIYGCGGDRETAKRFLSLPGWRDVEAVKNGTIFYFPCDLTCRASVNASRFVSWLSARIYEDEFSRKDNQVLEDRVFRSRNLDIDLDYIEDARIAYSHIHDFPNKTLIIDFKEPLSVLSTLEGQRKVMTCVGNHYSSPPCWGITHKLGLKEMRARVYEAIGKSEDTASFLFTGADMDNLAMVCERFRDMAVYALVTAGVKTNAVMMSKDEGRFYEPGTINIILLPNMRLMPRALTRAIISATEAKTAALMDMDVRSSETPRLHQATGTGTDNLIVVEGTGRKIDNVGGHSKMGELIARSVYNAVQEAVYKQNGMVSQRNIFQRLNERKIDLFGLISADECGGCIEKRYLFDALEKALLQPRYAAFIATSLAVSDSYERGLTTDLTSYSLWCKEIAGEIAGREIGDMLDLIAVSDLPVVQGMALNSLLNGIYLRMKGIP